MTRELPLPSPPPGSPAAQSRRNYPLLFVFGAGILYSISLVAMIPGEVFFSGDGGVKALLTKQFASGLLSVRLLLRAPAAVEQVWRDGLYPFRAPFVYPSDGGYTVAFPFFFEAICSPFYRLFGFHGLYLLPLACVWLTWVQFVRSLASLSLPGWARTAGLAALIFAFPLTLYSAMFWEHTLGVFLCYFGVAFLATYRLRPWSPLSSLGAGFACGIAFLIRSEASVFVFCVCAFALATGRSQRVVRLFVVGASMATLMALAINIAVYGTPIGAHGRQVVEGSSLGAQAMGGIRRGPVLWANLLLHCPLAIFPIVYLAFRWKTWRAVDPRGPYGLLAPCAAFLGIVPFIVPNTGGHQIGPRYVLVVVPALILIATVSLSQIAAVCGRREKWLAVLYGASLVAGLLWDTVRNGPVLAHDYDKRIMPALEFLRRDPDKLFATNETFAAQELEAVMPDKWPVLVKTQADEERALSAASELGQRGMLFVTFADAPPPPEATAVTLLGRYGGLLIYDVGPSGPRGSAREGADP